jgi:hyperosmotically inducible protein
MFLRIDIRKKSGPCFIPRHLRITLQDNLFAICVEDNSPESRAITTHCNGSTEPRSIDHRGTVTEADLLRERSLITMISSKWKHAASAATVVLCLTTGPFALGAQMPDNSGQNKDKPNQTLSADKQSNSKSDVQITAQIRKSLMADKSLSMYAHNVKIVTKNGAVTLKGPVKSEEEKAKVAEHASGVVSADKITNQLTVK